jgi:hypothetical protein
MVLSFSRNLTPSAAALPLIALPTHPVTERRPRLTSAFNALITVDVITYCVLHNCVGLLLFSASTYQSIDHHLLGLADCHLKIGIPGAFNRM